MVNSEIYHLNTSHYDYFTNILWILLNTRKECTIEVFNMIPCYIKIESDNPKKLKLILQIFLLIPLIL